MDVRLENIPTKVPKEWAPTTTDKPPPYVLLPSTPVDAT
jgi:hypothetical protein